MDIYVTVKNCPIKHNNISVHHIKVPETNLLTLRALLPPSGWSSMWMSCCAREVVVKSVCTGTWTTAVYPQCFTMTTPRVAVSCKPILQLQYLTKCEWSRNIKGCAEGILTCTVALSSAVMPFNKFL